MQLSTISNEHLAALGLATRAWTSTAYRGVAASARSGAYHCSSTAPCLFSCRHSSNDTIWGSSSKGRLQRGQVPQTPCHCACCFTYFWCRRFFGFERALRYRRLRPVGCDMGRNSLGVTPEPTPTNFGELRPRILLSGDQIVPRIEIGGTGTSITQTDPKDYGAYIFPFLKREQFKIEIVDRIAKFSTKITDENDHLIAEIVRNEWLVAPPPQSWDRNYNDDSLEVKDARGDIVLQVKVLSDRIQFQGVWWADRSSILAERSRVEIFENKAAHPWSAQIYIVPNNGSPKPIEPIFLYPSGRHLSELSKPQKSN
jgi:hypothetical protein